MFPKCLPCVIECKATHPDLDEVTALSNDIGSEVFVRDAITLLNGVPHCWHHIAIQRQSPLTVPPGGSLPNDGILRG